MNKVPESKLARAGRLVTAYREKFPEATISEACRACKVTTHAYNNYRNASHVAKPKKTKAFRPKVVEKPLAWKDNYKTPKWATPETNVDARITAAMVDFDELPKVPSEAKKAQPSDILSVAGRLSEALREVTRLKVELKDLL